MIAESPGPNEQATVSQWEVTALSLPTERVIELLCYCAGRETLSQGVVVGADLAFRAQAVRFSGSIVARQSLLPGTMFILHVCSLQLNTGKNEQVTRELYVITYVIIRLILGGQAMAVLKVTTVGNSVGVILPKELLERLRVGKGDSLYVIETKQGIELTPYNPEFANQMEVAERVMREDRDALRKLAE